MRKERRNIAFSLSFLDIMACGFGAVTLLFIILSYNIEDEVSPNITGTAEIERLEDDLDMEEDNLIKIKDDLRLARTTLKAAREKYDALKRQDQIPKVDLPLDDGEYKNLEESIKELELALIELEEGEAQERWYGKNLMTGLDFSGQQILILVDGSASMLSETVQEGIQLGFAIKSGQATIEDAEKWQWVVKTVIWLVANIGENIAFQIYIFNTGAESAVADTFGQWLSPDQLVKEEAIEGVRKYSPNSGTSLENVLAEIKALNPRPDLVFLLTDGLPTQGQTRPNKYMVTPSERRKYFLEALEKIPPSIPVSTILYPLDGDPEAALLYWKLAYDSKGSFITPSRDWP